MPEPVVERIDISTPPERVFDGLVQPAQLGKWGGAEDMYRTRWDVDLRVGEEYLWSRMAQRPWLGCKQLDALWSRSGRMHPMACTCATRSACCST
jgi:uncharacterized protein YndB with AHSA1/START domain